MTSVAPTPEWQRLTEVLEHLFDPVVVLRPVRDDFGFVADFRYLHANQAACDYNGLTLDQTLGRALSAVLPGETFERIMPAYQRVLVSGDVFREAESASFSLARQEFLVAESRCVCVGGDLVVTWRDHTDRALEVQVATDALTGLANRRALHDRLPDMLRAGEARGRRVAVLFCDLDNFKAVNDAHGHAVGDTVLRAIANRFRLAVRSDDLVIRLSGDELLVVLNDVADAGDALRVAEQLRTALTTPVTLSDIALHVTASFGLCIATTGESVHALLQRADSAMYRAKRAGRNRVALA